MSRLPLLLWLVIMQNANAPAAAAPAPAARQLVRLPTGPDEAKLAKNRKTVKGWFEGKNRKPWLYELRRRTNFGACKACYHFKANISDQLTKGEFKLVHDGRIRVGPVARAVPGWSALDDGERVPPGLYFVPVYGHRSAVQRKVYDRYPQGLDRQWPAELVPRRSSHTQVLEAARGRNRKRTSACHMRVSREQKGR